MTKIIALANHKGGVGKTCSAASIGAGLARTGFKTLLIDLDAQANLTSSLLTAEPDKSIYESLIQGEALPIIPVADNLDIVASSLDLAAAEIELTSKMDREYLLKDLLEPIESNYSYIVIDCPPSLGILTINALVAASDLYIPLTAEVLPARGLNTIIENLSKIQQRANKALALTGIIITRWAGRNINKAIEEQLRGSFKDAVFNTKIRENISLAEAPLQGQDIYTYSPTSNGAKDYAALVDEIIQRTK